MAGTLVLDALDARGFDVTAAAKALGFTRWRTSKIVHGIARPTSGEVAAIAGLLGLDVVRVALDATRTARRSRRARA